MMRSINVFLLALCLAVAAFAQSDEESLHAVVGKYYDAYARKDWQTMAGLLSEASPMRGRVEAFHRQFGDGELRFTEPAISRLKVEGNKASLRVSTRRTASFKNRNTTAITEVRAEMAFVKENGRWALWAETSPLAGLVNLLTEAKTDDERRKLLDDDRDLITRDLLFMLNGQSDRAYAQGDHTRSLSVLQSLILVADRLGDKNELSEAWHKAGIIHFLQKRFDQALAAYRKGLAIEEELGRKYESARSLSSIGLVYLGQTKFAEATDHFNRALVIYESLGRKNEAAETMENIGNVHYEQGDYPRAVELYQRCLKLRDEAKRTTQAASLVLKIARVEFEQGHDTAALDLYRQAADRLVAAGDRRSLGYALHNAANVLYEQGDYNQALSFYQRSLQAEREAGTREGEAGALQGIGLIHSLNGNYTLALDAYERNLAVTRALGNRKDMAVAWQKVGGSFYSLGKLEESLASYKEALALREGIGEGQETALALLDVGVTLSAKQDYTAALEHYARSRQLFEQAGDLAGIAAALLNTSQVHYLQGDFAKTLEVAAQATDFAKRASDQDLFWQSRHRAGKAHFRLNDSASARKALTEAIATIETMRPQSSRGQQPRFYETKNAPYLAMVDVALGEGQGNEAYNFAQRAKTRLLTGLLQVAKTQIVKTMTPREQEQERQLLADITNFNARFYREQERERPNAARVAELKAKLQKAQADYSDFRTKLYALRPRLKTLRGEIKPATVEQAAVMAGDAKTALLEFVETEERVYLFVFAKNYAKAGQGRAAASTLKIFGLDTTRGDLYARVSRFNQAIAGRDDSVNMQARELYDLLIKQAQPAFAGKTHLIIAPDAISWGLPFQALRSEAERYLIEDFDVSYTPSLTILSAIASTRPVAPVQAKAGATKPLALLAVGNPVLSQDVTERIKLALSLPQVEPLAESDREVTELTKLYGAEQSLPLVGAAATEDHVKAEIGKARLIHFAARGVHHEASPLFSLLAFAPNPEVKEDGVLELRELLRLDLKADLVVMSASEWAQPRTITNRTMTAWTWAWFVAGNPSVLLSQWRTDPTELMVGFHQQLKKPRQAKASAWAAAVRQQLSREDQRHPYFWAGFTLLANRK